MTMSDTIMVISLIAGFGICLTSIGLLCHALFPKWTVRSEARLRTRPYSTMAVGVFVGLAVFFLGVALLNAPHPAIKVVGGAVILSVLLFSFAGCAGLSRFVGSRLPSPADAERPWKAVIRGWVVIYLAALLPIFGWFVFLPLALLSGVGAALLSMRQPAAPRVEVAVPAKNEVLV